MFNSPLYGKWKQQLLQLLPERCQTRIENMLLMMIGMYEARTVHLSKIAQKLPIRAQKLSLDKRLRRFLANEAVEAERWYSPWAQWLVQAGGSGGRLHLVMDTTKVSSHYRQLSVAIAYHRRALPLMWDWVPYARGHCTVQQQVALLARVQASLPAGVQVSLVGDGEFGNPLLIEYLDGWGWEYALRQKSDTLIWKRAGTGWERLDKLDLQRGEQRWLGNVVLSQASAYPCHVVLVWQRGLDAPLFLATNQLDSRSALRLYRRRMWIEEMYGDMKGHGFDLEASCLRHPDRLSRLTLVVCILYLWLTALGEHVLANHLSAEVDRTDRRDLSIFRLGWDWLERRLALHDPVPPLFCPTFSLVSGG